MKETFKFTLKVKNCDKEFKQGLGNGVLMTETFEIEVPDNPSSFFTGFLLGLQNDIIKDNIEVEMEKI